MHSPTRDDGTPSTFCWNAGGWFGALIGGTSWIGLSAVLLAFSDAGLGMWLALIYLALTCFGTWLWRQRGSVRAYPAVQVMVVSVCAASLLTTLVIDSHGRWDTLGTGANISAGYMYLLILGLFGGLVASFHLRERDARRRRAEAGP